MLRSKKYQLNHHFQNGSTGGGDGQFQDGHQPPPLKTSPPTTTNDNDKVNCAVIVDSVEFNYKKHVPVLQDVSINVPKGKIYSLLGSNGCGKTTLLNILLGRIKPHRGSLWILGQRPGPILNHLIGYMPQELGLNSLLQINDTFYYYAHVNHVKDMRFIRAEIRKYLKMLGLQDPRQKVGQLSGGQKRLLSLGVTLIYKPKILLLDEPTVGIDSLIRSKIWSHLRQLCQQDQTTVIITTHYIDEAKQSDLVGFLHQGQLLAEESPDVLMQYLHCRTLEQVFLKLCCDHQDTYNNGNHHNHFNINNNNTKCYPRRQSNTIVQKKDSNYFRFTKNGPNGTMVPNGTTTTIKNGTANNNHQNHKHNNHAHNNHCQDDMNNNDGRFPNAYADNKRDGYPDGQTMAINNGNGNKNGILDHSKSKGVRANFHDPDAVGGQQQNNNNNHRKCSKYFLDLDHMFALMMREWFFFSRNLIIFAVYLLMPMLTIYLFDSSYGRTPRNVPVAIHNGDQSDFHPHLSDMFLEEFNTSMVRMNFFPNESSAIRSVELGRNTLAISFRRNFSSSLVERYYNFHSFDSHKKPDQNPDDSMHLYIDHSSLLNVRYVNRSILLAFQRTIERFGLERGINPQIFSLPIEKKEYVYGTLEPHFQDLFTPGIIIIVLVGLNTCKSSFEIIFLHQNGCLKRDINQGVRPFEMLSAFVGASMISIFWQTMVLMIFTYRIMDVPMDGDFTSACILVYTCACQGLLIGTFLSVLFPDQIISMLLCFTTLVVMFFTSGTLWPIEGMQPHLQKLFLLNPIVLPVRSLRFIMLRGWSVWKFSVMIGYLISSGFCLVLFILSAFFFHYLNIRIK